MYYEDYENEEEDDEGEQDDENDSDEGFENGKRKEKMFMIERNAAPGSYDRGKDILRTKDSVDIIRILVPAAIKIYDKEFVDDLKILNNPMFDDEDEGRSNRSSAQTQITKFMSSDSNKAVDFIFMMAYVASSNSMSNIQNSSSSSHDNEQDNAVKSEDDYMQYDDYVAQRPQYYSIACMGVGLDLTEENHHNKCNIQWFCACTCPDMRQGWCKHIIAVQLKYTKEYPFKMNLERPLSDFHKKFYQAASKYFRLKTKEPIDVVKSNLTNFLIPKFVESMNKQQRITSADSCIDYLQYQIGSAAYIVRSRRSFAKNGRSRGYFTKLGDFNAAIMANDNEFIVRWCALFIEAQALDEITMPNMKVASQSASDEGSSSSKRMKD